MGERRIEVNIADFSVALLEGDAVVHQARVIVGKPETPTPIFSNVMRYVIINPSWQVPNSIIKKEIMPKLGSLSRRGYEVKTVGGRLTVRQLPGERQRARALRLHVSERLCDLPARYAGARIVRRGHARLQPRLRPSRRPPESGRDRPRRRREPMDSRANRGGRRRPGKDRLPARARCPSTSSTSLNSLTNSANCRSGRTSMG